MIEMTVHRVGLCAQDGGPIVVLRERHGHRFVPVKVSAVQANAIMRHTHRMPPFRPQTHEVFVAAIKAMGAQITCAHLDEINERGFGASITVVRDAKSLSLPCTAADAVVLAVRSDAPILVSPTLVERLSGSDSPRARAPAAENTPATSAPDAFRDFIDSLSTIDDLGRG